jgi:hypothetical protein
MHQDFNLAVWAPFGILVLASALVALHHYYIHSINKYDKAREESCAVCCYLQPSDMRNHEIWVISLLAVAVTWTTAGYTFEHVLGC